jgi:hypothetical protein
MLKQDQTNSSAENDPYNFLLALIPAILVLITLLTLTGCGPTTVRARQKVRDVATHLPEPSEAVLVERVDGIRGGSDRKCWTAYSVALYGTSQDFETTLNFYTEILSTLDWQETKFSGLFRRSDGVSLEILTEQDAWASLAIPMKTRQESRQQFSVIYFVSLTYGNPDEREYCKQ